jgi:hypothetical protein
MKVRLKAPAEQAAGRQLQELVYYLWRGVQYARGWVRGSNPGSADQVAARSAFSAITKRWETLDASVREGWDTWASANTVVDSLGREVRMPALAAYVRVNSIGYALNGSYTDAAPTDATPSPVTSVGAYKNDSGTCTIYSVAHPYSTLTGLSLMVKQVVLASPAVSMTAGKGALFAGYGQDSFIDLAANNGSYELASARVVPPVGANVGVVLQIVNAAGLASLPFTANLEVVSP